MFPVARIEALPPWRSARLPHERWHLARHRRHRLSPDDPHGPRLSPDARHHPLGRPAGGEEPEDGVGDRRVVERPHRGRDDDEHARAATGGLLLDELVRHRPAAEARRQLELDDHLARSSDAERKSRMERESSQLLGKIKKLFKIQR